MSPAQCSCSKRAHVGLNVSAGGAVGAVLGGRGAGRALKWEFIVFLKENRPSLSHTERHAALSTRFSERSLTARPERWESGCELGLVRPLGASLSDPVHPTTGSLGGDRCLAWPTAPPADGLGHTGAPSPLPLASSFSLPLHLDIP